MRKLSANKGAALILTFIIMVTLTAITTGFLFMTSSHLRGSAYDVTSSKALWIAEAGLQQAIYQIKNDSDYRDSPTAIDANLGNGSYSVSADKNGATYTLASTGTVDTLNRKVTQSIDITIAFPVAFNYAVFGNTNSNELKIEDEVAISGDVYYDGDVEVEEDASVTGGLVYADSVSGDGTYIEASGPPDPVPTYLTFDTTWYDDKISIAEGASGGSDLKLEGSEIFDLAGGTYNYNKVEIKDSASITGTGTIIAKKEVKIEDDASISSNVSLYSKEKIDIKDSVTIGASATIVSKKDIKIESDVNISSNSTIITKAKMEVKDDAIIQSGAVLYGKNEIKLKDSANVTGSLIVPTNNKKVKMENDSTLTGIIYGDKVELKGDAVISGSVVANEYEGDKIKDDVSITYDQSSLPSSLPTGIQEGDATVTPQSDWDEVVPAT